MKKLLYEGKAKRIFQTDDEQIVLVEYKDSATAYNGQKKADISGKGRLNNKITSLLFLQLREQGIESHFIERVSETEQLVKKVAAEFSIPQTFTDFDEFLAIVF